MVHRGLELRERAQYRAALNDLHEGLAIARQKRMGGIAQLKGFIREAQILLEKDER